MSIKTNNQIICTFVDYDFLLCFRYEEEMLKKADLENEFILTKKVLKAS